MPKFSDIYRHPCTYAVHTSAYPIADQLSSYKVFSCIIVAWGAFCLPGAFGALNGMGAGTLFGPLLGIHGLKPTPFPLLAGQVDATVSNAANAIVFGVLAVCPPLDSIVSTKTHTTIIRSEPSWRGL